jgi:hypothetical protein
VKPIENELKILSNSYSLTLKLTTEKKPNVNVAFSEGIHRIEFWKNEYAAKTADEDEDTLQNFQLFVKDIINYQWYANQLEYVKQKMFWDEFKKSLPYLGAKFGGEFKPFLDATYMDEVYDAIHFIWSGELFDKGSIPLLMDKLNQLSSDNNKKLKEWLKTIGFEMRENESLDDMNKRLFEFMKKNKNKINQNQSNKTDSTLNNLKQKTDSTLNSIKQKVDSTVQSNLYNTSPEAAFKTFAGTEYKDFDESTGLGIKNNNTKWYFENGDWTELKN